MQAFRATYKPKKYDVSGGLIGYNDDKAETVLIVKILCYDTGIQPDAVFIHSDGALDTAPIDCFTGCLWEE